MKKAIIAAALAVLVTAGVAGAQGNGQTKVVHAYCVHVETGTEYPSYGDFNAFRGDLKFCVKGKPGKNGKRGKPGRPGTNGTNGIDGKDGTGTPGAAGATGATGAQGPAGAEGPAGPQGETGATGAQGPQGETGATGAQGPQGEQGPPGPGANLGDLYACTSGGNNAKIVESIDECDPGHDTIYKIDGVRVQPAP